MENFFFALNATVPVFLVILAGYFLQRVGLLNDGFNRTANQYVFQCALPVSLFRSIAGMDFYSEFDPRFCLFCFAATTGMFLGVWGASALLLRDKSQVGAFAQASARSSAAILGVAFAVSIYGDAGMVPMMIMASVPFFNLYSVLILSLMDCSRLKTRGGVSFKASSAEEERVLVRCFVLHTLSSISSAFPFWPMTIPL